VRISAMAPKGQNILVSLFNQFLPVLLLIGVWVYFMRQMQGGAGGRGAMSFGKSRARLLGEDQVKVTFVDVAGVEEAKEEVSEIVDFLKDPASSSGSAARSRRASSWWARPVPARRCWPGPSPAKPGSVLHDFRLGFRRNVRGRGRIPRARHVRAGQEACALHHLHR